MFIFTAYIIVILEFSQNLPCPCGGLIQSMNWYQHLAFNLFFLLLAFMGIIINDNLKGSKYLSRQ
jgi:hypothetical protein